LPGVFDSISDSVGAHISERKRERKNRKRERERERARILPECPSAPRAGSAAVAAAFLWQGFPEPGQPPKRKMTERTGEQVLPVPTQEGRSSGLRESHPVLIGAS